MPEPEKLGSASKGKRNLGLDADESPDSKKSRHELEIPEIPDDICQYYLRGSCRFGSSCKSKHDPFARAKYVKVVSQQPRRIGSLKLPKPAESLLKKLLEKEIHTEQSIVLQSFRFFVQNNFFSPSTTEDKINL